MSGADPLTGSVEIRPLREDDIAPAKRCSDALFLDAERRGRRIDEPEPLPRSPAASRQWVEHMRHFLQVDPDSCWVADADGRIVGFAISQNRGRVQFLATYGVLRLVVSDSPDRPGYVYVDDRGRPSLLAAGDDETAQTLLWEALASSHGETLVNCITTANHSAIDVGLAARLEIGQEGYLALRGLREPAPYLASGQFL